MNTLYLLSGGCFVALAALSSWLWDVRRDLTGRLSQVCAEHQRTRENLRRITELHEKACRERNDAELAVEDLKRNAFPNLPVGEPDWSEAHDAAVAQFFHQNESGVRLMSALEYLEQYQNRRAVLSHQNTPYLSGYAAGWHGCVAYLKSLSSKSRLQTGPNNPTGTALPNPGDRSESNTGEFDAAEQYAP
jgi:hypothetical protein